MEVQVLVLVVSFVLFLLMNVPIAVAIGLSTFLTIFSVGTLPTSYIIAQRMSLGIASFPLLAIPFFVLSGILMGKGGMARRLIDFADSLMGRLPGGLSYVSTLTCMMFGAISGSAAAAISSVGGFMIPEMNRKGYGKNFNVAVTITAGTTGLLIPPSNTMIVYAVVASNVSVAAMFMAGILPGIVVGVAIMIVCAILSFLRGYGGGMEAGVKGLMITLWSVIESLAFLLVAAGGVVCVLLGLLRVFIALFNDASLDASVGLPWLIGVIAILVALLWHRLVSASRRELYTRVMRSFKRAILSLLLILIVIGGILAGYFSATEASAIAVLYALILGMVVYREVRIRHLPDILLQAGKTTAIVMLLIGTSQAMSWILAYQQIPEQVSAALLAISDNPIVILLVINCLLLAVGTFMDMTPAVLIFTPIFLPVVIGLGMSPVHFGIIMIANLCIGLCTPPVGTCLFLGCGVGKTTIAKVTPVLIPFFIAMIGALMLITYIPWLSMAIPRWLDLVQ
ncbi:MAG: TRAP transporter large permease [Sedimentisphaerales bacterium]|nr:TRAP transporter large permease [Sedimentisphaerales bacterium]